MRIVRLIPLLLYLMPLFVFGQSPVLPLYRLAVTQEEYVPIETGIVLDENDTAAHAEKLTVEPGFPMIFGGDTVYALTIEQGRLYVVANSMSDNAQRFIPYNRSMSILRESKILYTIQPETSLCAGRTLVMEWRNFGAYCDSSKQPLYSWQIAIHEGTNIIEARFKENKKADTATEYCARRNPAMFGTEVNSGVYNYRDSFPPTGTTYRLSPVDLYAESFVIYPNPVAEELNIQRLNGCGTFQVKVFTLHGEMVYSGTRDEEISRYKLYCSEGSYYVVISTRKGVYTYMIAH